MKPHLVIKTHQPRSAKVPFWGSFIADKRECVESFHPSFDALARRHDLSFWATSEYRPAGGEWSRHEVEAGLNRFYRLILRQDFALPANFVDHVRLISDFEFVRPLAVSPSDLIPSTSYVASRGDNSRDRIYLNHAHRLFGRGRGGVKVAVLDTGVDLTHPELERRISARADFVNLAGLDTNGFIGDTLGFDAVPEDEVGHGSHVAGIIAGAGHAMPVGVAPECEILAVRVLATLRIGERLCGAGILDNINTGIKWAVDSGADVINMSLGIRHSGGGLPHEEIIRYALSRGVTIVAASGNDGTDEKYYPGALPGVIAVGAVDAAGQVTLFTSFGAQVWVVAPGTDVYSSFNGGRYAAASGTSQASPFVTGAVALLMSQGLGRGVRLTGGDVKDILRRTADKLDRRERSERGGYGRLNVLDACRYLDYATTTARAAS